MSKRGQLIVMILAGLSCLGAMADFVWYMTTVYDLGHALIMLAIVLALAGGLTCLVSLLGWWMEKRLQRRPTVMTDTYCCPVTRRRCDEPECPLRELR